MSDDTLTASITPDYSQYINPQLRERVKQLNEGGADQPLGTDGPDLLEAIQQYRADSLAQAYKSPMMPHLTLSIPAPAQITAPAYQPSPEKQLADAINELVKVLKSN